MSGIILFLDFLFFLVSLIYQEDFFNYLQCYAKVWAPLNHFNFQMLRYYLEKHMVAVCWDKIRGFWVFIKL